MRYNKTIVCLANSRKPPAGRCVAGRELAGTGFGGWVRAVSARRTLEVSLEERRYCDGRDPSLLDVVSIEMKEPQPQRHQRENHVIDSAWYWVHQGVINWQHLQSAVEDPAGPLWINGLSSYNGLNDQVDEKDADALRRSLYLIRPERLELIVASEAKESGPARRRVRARFELCGHPYKLPVTDPVVESNLLGRADAEYSMADALLCVSLSEGFHGFSYKLAAAVIAPTRPGS